METLEEAIEDFSHFRQFFSQHRLELKEWIRNSDEFSETTPVDLKWISYTKQVAIEPNSEGSSVLGLQWTVSDDSLKVCNVTNKEVETPITQRKVLSLLSSVYDPTRLFAPFSIYMRRLLKSIWYKNGQYWDHKMEPGEKQIS